MSIFMNVISEFVLGRKVLVGRITKELLSLMDIYKRRLPLLASTSGDILEVFLVKHSLVCNQLGRFSFSSKTFRPEEKNRRTLSPTSGQGPGFGQAINEVAPQTSGLRTFLRGKYAAKKLYQATQIYLPSDALDIGVNPGDLVGVIQTKDPMGNSKRWFVDNGESQGFLPAHILNPIGDEADLKCIPNDNTANTSTTTHAYDDVAKDESESTTDEPKDKTMEEESNQA